PEVNGLFSVTGQASWEYIGRGSTPRRPAEIEQAISQLRVFARPWRSAARLSGTLGGADYKPKLSLAEVRSHFGGRLGSVRHKGANRLSDNGSTITSRTT